MSIVTFATVLLASYCCIGAAIKLVDALQDEVRGFRGRSTLAWAVTTVAVVLVDLWVLLDAYTAGLALALLLGLVATGKVDNRYFLVLGLMTLPLAFLALLRVDVFLLVLPMLLALAPAAALDECLDAVGSRFGHASLRLLARSRPVMKVVVLVLPFWGFLTFFHAIAFWGFDIAYGLVGYVLRAPVSMP